MLTFSYLPYALAEGIHLSGEMTNTSIIISLNQTFLSLKIWYCTEERKIHCKETPYDCSINT